VVAGTLDASSSGVIFLQQTFVGHGSRQVIKSNWPGIGTGENHRIRGGETWD